MSRLTQSIHLCFGLPRFLLPGGTISIVFLPTYSWSRLSTWPNHLSRAFLHLSAILSTFSLSLMLLFLTWSLSVWPQYYVTVCQINKIPIPIMDFFSQFFPYVGCTQGWSCLVARAVHVRTVELARIEPTVITVNVFQASMVATVCKVVHFYIAIISYYFLYLVYIYF